MAAFAAGMILVPLLYIGGAALFFYVLYRVVRKAVRDAYWDTHGNPRQ